MCKYYAYRGVIVVQHKFKISVFNINKKCETEEPIFKIINVRKLWNGAIEKIKSDNKKICNQYVIEKEYKIWKI